MNKFARLGWVALAAMGCAGFADDSVWLQQKSVAIGAANFQQCVKTAVVAVQGVSINLAATNSANTIALDVKLAKPIPFLDAQVQHRGGNAVVSFTGNGDKEPDQDRKTIDPVLQSIADSIGKTCGAGKAATSK
jgi:hypothetical protein